MCVDSKANKFDTIFVPRVAFFYPALQTHFKGLVAWSTSLCLTENQELHFRSANTTGAFKYVQYCTVFVPSVLC